MKNGWEEDGGRRMKNGWVGDRAATRDQTQSRNLKFRSIIMIITMVTMIKVMMTMVIMISSLIMVIIIIMMTPFQNLN